MRRHTVTCALALIMLALGAPGPARAEPIYAVTQFGGAELLVFESAAPGLLTRFGLTGIAPGQAIAGIDFRPATNQLYAVTRSNIGAQTTGFVYRIDLGTNAATQVATVTLPLSSFGVDFDPVTDRLRIVSGSGENLRVNVETGEVARDAGLTYLPGDVNAGRAPTVTGLAYGNPVAGATTPYGIDATLGTLVTLNPAAAGTLTTLGSLGVGTNLIGRAVGFDISGVTGTAYASVPISGDPAFWDLFTVDLGTGAAARSGTILVGFNPITGIAVSPAETAPIPEPATMLLLGTGLAGVGVVARRRRKGGKVE